ncbi:CcdB family protein [Citrobacter youngae]|uniref:CcdB family protein n=1 Tax=Citrobacter youngae TaxID=133448 RepID=UPI00215036ED|nr:CcdB family protein [Citrobacter youngae]UUX54210.1 CcdB family protein [Citrobacter youngae]
MEQYCAYENTGSGKSVYPFLISLQHPVAAVLQHVLAAPVIALSQFPNEVPPAKICPVVSIGGQAYVVMTYMMTGIPVKNVGNFVGDLTANRAELRDAIDFLINGY